MTIDRMYKVIDRYEAKLTEMQKQIDSLTLKNASQYEKNQRLNNELIDFMDLHQNEMSTTKTDRRKLEEKLLYNLNEYWTETVERLDKLDTRVSSSFKCLCNRTKILIGLLQLSHLVGIQYSTALNH